MVTKPPMNPASEFAVCKISVQTEKGELQLVLVFVSLFICSVVSGYVTDMCEECYCSC